MTWFVDASAIVALAGLEDDWREIAALMDEDAERLWSPMARWEAIGGTRRRLNTDLETAIEEVDQIARINRFTMVTIGATEADAASNAMRRYGKGSGSAARLNMGDCFAYACAQTNDARLLYKGSDFDHTDLAL